MKKSVKIFMIILLFFSSAKMVYGQEAYFELSITGDVGNGGVSCGNQRGLQWIELIYEDNTVNRYFDPGIYENKALVTPKIKFYDDNKIKAIKFHTNRRHKTLVGDCRSNRSTGEVKLKRRSKRCYDRRVDFDGWLSIGGHANIKIVPVIKLRRPSGVFNFGEEDYLRMPSINGGSRLDFHWEYSFSPFSGYKLLPDYTQDRNFLEVKGKDFLKPEDHGKYVYFKVNTRCNGSESNVVRYRYLKDAPNFVSSTSEKTSCYSSTDGKIKLKLDRKLSPGEILSITTSNPSRTFKTADFENLTAADFSSDNWIEIKGLAPGVYPLALSGFYRGVSTFTESVNHRITVTVTRPNPVEFWLNKVDVFCHGGNDGAIKISAKGGRSGVFQYVFKNVNDTSPIQDSDWKTFSNTGTWPSYQVAEVVENLEKGENKIRVRVRDANGCQSKTVTRDAGGNIIGVNDLIEQEIEIKQPDNPLEVSFVYKKEPSGFGFSDGEMTARIVGGTPLANKKYNYTWTHEKGGVVTTWTNFRDEVIDDASEKAYYITLQNGIDGNYSLTITDANYTGATNKIGCRIINETNNLKEPEKLSVKIKETKSISCNSNNIFNNPFGDGELKAEAKGGVPFSPLKEGKYKYEYTWKKKDALGNYQIIPGENGNVLSNREEGEYAVNIKDKNDIIVGTYVNNIIEEIKDATLPLKAPDLLKITYTKQDVFCHNGTDGTIDVTIKGGTGDYTIKWSNNATIEDISSLTAGTYTIKVTDDKGCEAEETIEIEEPKNPLKIAYRFFEPTFAGATNGWLEATVTGGTPLDTNEYTFVWRDSNGNDLVNQVTSTVTTEGNVLTLNELGEDTYKLTIQDKNYPLAIDKPNCTIIDIESEYVLNDPEPLQARIIERKPISCNSTNVYGDLYSDGELEVIASGGLKLQSDQNNGFSYYYTWKKETSPGVWTVLPSQTTNIASGLADGNYAVNIKDANGIVIGEYRNNVLVTPRDIIKAIKEPELLEVSVTVQHVYCIGGSDGWANAFVKGGTAPYTFEWDNGQDSSIISELSKGVYKLRVTDDRGCQVATDVIVEEPKNALNITFSEFATPTTKDASDGWVVAQITGGTLSTLGVYTYYWQDETGSLLNAQTTAQFVNNVYEITLNNIPKGNYFLTIEDANYEVATTKKGCTRIDEEFNLYDPIEAVITIKNPISCNQNNTFSNPFSDGALKVTVTGGTPFDSGNSYKYFWKKKNDAGIYEDLGVNNQILADISEGNYAVNVEDSRGVVIGEYKSLNLVNATGVLFTFEEPELLTLSLSATEISCDLGNNGTATVVVSGGIPPYDIQWSNEDTGVTATNLISGNYLVFVTDSRGCQATGNISLTPPGGLKIEIVTQKNPTCFKGDDGEIELNISGGIPPYTYSWDTRESATNISNLKEGTYRFSLEDAKGCKVFLDVKLEDPDEITIDLGEDKTLCNSQSYVLDGSIEDSNATYLWTSDNGFTSTDASVTVNEKGIYTVTATSSNGCIATDSMTVIYSNVDIDADFLMSSQAYVDEEVVIFNASDHKPESFEWLLPEKVIIVERRANSIIVKFLEAKMYEIGLLSKEGDCSQELFKTIVIEESDGLTDLEDTNVPFIESFTISPNPNSGIFSTNVKLAEPGEIAIRIFNMQGELMKKQATSEVLKEHENPFNIPMSSGMYIVVLETAKQTQVKRMIVN